MRLRHSLSIGVMVLAATATASLWSAEPQTTARAAAPSTPRLEHQTFALPNGLKVILSQDSGCRW